MKSLAISALLASPLAVCQTEVPDSRNVGFPDKDWRAAMDACDVVWQSPGKGERDCMPLGNGVLAVMLWTCPDGKVEFYLARPDAITETDRMVKLGKVSLKLEPNPFEEEGFKQVLHLRDGSVQIEAGAPGNRVHIKVFIDANAPVLRVAGQSDKPTAVSATYISWRTQPRNSESADIVASDGDGILFYHRNETSCVPALAKLEVPGFESKVPDPYIHRTFGGRMTLSGAKDAKDDRLSTQPANSFELRVATNSRQTDTVEEWKSQLTLIEGNETSSASAETATSAWWNAYWQRSWVFVSNDPAIPSINGRPPREGSAPPAPSKITQAYMLTRFMTVCAARGAYPIHWAGSLFMPMAVNPGTVHPSAADLTDDPPAEPSINHNPDERPWGNLGFLWQNERLPYASMPARGETDLMASLFDYYSRFADLDRARAKLYWGAEGQHSTEMSICCGLQPGDIYGMDRKGKPPYLTANRWGGAVEISPGLERINMMLDSYAYTGDETFLRKQILPYAHDLFLYIETRFRERRNGKIVLSPLHAVETYWDVTNPQPVVAGMQSVLNHILALRKDLVADRGDYVRWRAMTPELPEADTPEGCVFVTAEGNLSNRHNVETPETYAIFPFRLLGIGRPALDEAIRTFRHALHVSGGWRPFKPQDNPSIPSYSGWQQSAMNAALLGLTKEASEALVHNAAYNNPNYRFPAMWGPVYDSVPDTDHGANLLNTTQLMLLQADPLEMGGKIYLLPAWPKEWNVWFKLYAPGNTTVECVVKDGRLAKLQVSPQSRARDIVLSGNFVSSEINNTASPNTP